MGNPKGVPRDLEALEQRRMAAVSLFTQGLNNSEIGRQLKVSNQTVSRWRMEYNESGVAAMRKAERAGRKPLLSPSQLEQLKRQLKARFSSIGCQAPPWTSQHAAELIEQEFGVHYHSGHVWRLIRGMGWSPHPDSHRAPKRRESSVADESRATSPAAGNSSA